MDNHIDDLIADYLADTLDPATRQDFERRLAADPDLAARIELETSLIDALGASPENHLRSTLRSIAGQYETPESLSSVEGNTPKSKARIWWFFTGFLVLIGAVALLILRQQEEPAPPIPPTLQQESPTPTPGAPTEDLPKTNDPQPNNSPRPSRPVAADFQPIKNLETYIGSQVRSGDFRLYVEDPRSGVTFRAGRMNFRLSGKTEGAIPAGQTFHTMLFSNDLKDFEAMRPVENLALALKPDARFLLEKKISLQPGLYYIIIEEEQSGEWLFVDKFLVK